MFTKSLVLNYVLPACFSVLGHVSNFETMAAVPGEPQVQPMHGSARGLLLSSVKFVCSE